VRRWGRGLLLSSVVLQGCSNLDEGSGGVVGLQITAPPVNTIEVGQTLQLSAVALDRDGNPVAAEVTWQAPDTTLTVDGTGTITGVFTGSGRVQAFAGSLASSLVTFSVIAAADTLVIAGDSVFTVPAGVTNTAPLVVQLRSFSPDAALPSRPVIYTVTSPPDVGPHTVELPGAVLSDTVLTGTDGAVSSVTLIRVNGTTQPDTAIVEVRAVRASGAAVPGSGQRFIVLFQ
jgi:Big-like domain-containing protein